MCLRTVAGLRYRLNDAVFVPVFVLVHDNNTIMGYCKCERT